MYDFIQRLGVAQEKLTQVKSRLAQVDRCLHLGAELETRWEQLRKARVELQIV